MQRIRLDALREQAGRLYLEGKPFTGIVYEVQGNRVTANYRVAEGVRGAPAEAWDPDRPRVLFPALTVVSADETDERFPVEGNYLGGAPFWGIAYYFDKDTGALFKEEDLHPTRPGPSREWYPSGGVASRVSPSATGRDVGVGSLLRERANQGGASRPKWVGTSRRKGA
jgi:hypothetical protein